MNTITGRIFSQGKYCVRQGYAEDLYFRLRRKSDCCSEIYFNHSNFESIQYFFDICYNLQQLLKERASIDLYTNGYFLKSDEIISFYI